MNLPLLQERRQPPFNTEAIGFSSEDLKKIKKQTFYLDSRAPWCATPTFSIFIFRYRLRAFVVAD